MKNHVTHLSMDENSDLVSCPDDEMYRKGRAAGYA